MKFNYNLFSYTLCLLCTEILYSQSAHAVSCGAGQYPYLSWCHDCTEGCYCTGPGFHQGWGYLYSCDTDKAKTKFGASWQDSGWNNVYTCPKDFPKSEKKAKSVEDCYVEIAGKKIYNKRATVKAGQYLPMQSNTPVACKTDNDKTYCPGGTFSASLTSDQGLKKCSDSEKASSDRTKCEHINVKCEAGRYLPSGWSSCSPCKSDGNRYYCPGGSFSAAPSTNMGLKECPSGKVANSDKTGCIVPPTHCDPGQYLPRGATQCKDCKSRYYLCAGGPITVGLTYDQGIRKCDGNLVANAENTSCVTDTVAKENLELIKSLPAGTISVPAGKYLPAGKRTPATCRGTTNYCPGGDFDEASVDQGIVECPKNTRANKDKTACTATFTKIQMQYGPYGKDTPYTRQCWLKTDSAEDFKSCVFGTK